ncbi:MAG: metallophosphoesterase [Desulfuromonadaceae bacterium]|nr:metallophosphoesterase [Desulfuromonadaceae bacterium]
MGVLLFVLLFLMVYELMHALVFWGMYPLLANHPVLPSLVWCWMGLLFIAFCLFAAMACWHLLALITKKLLPDLPLLTIHRPAGAALVLLVTLCTGLYGVYEATDLRIEKIQLNSEKLPFGRERLQPDLLVATGDIVDAQMDHLIPLSELWHRIDPPLGKYVVTGNHEYYAGLDQSLDFLKRSRFTVLRNEGITVKQTVTLVGVNDPTGG